MRSRRGKKVAIGATNTNWTSRYEARYPSSRCGRVAPVRTANSRNRMRTVRRSFAMDRPCGISALAVDHRRRFGTLVAAGAGNLASVLCHMDATEHGYRWRHESHIPGDCFLCCNISDRLDDAGLRTQPDGARTRCVGSDLSQHKPAAFKEQYGETFLMWDLVKDLFAFMRERKKYWLVPIMVVMVLLGVVLVLAQGSALAPFIYALF